MIWKFHLFGFPIAVQPFFFLTAFFIGPRNSAQEVLLWIPAVFFGVLAHELGHALAARQLGFHPVILLHGFGGQTSWKTGEPPSTLHQVFLSAAGPGVGILLGIVIMGTRILFPTLQEGATGNLLIYLFWVNFGWGLLNLLPVLPLDGGQIASTIAGSIFGPRGRFVALIFSLLLTSTLALWSILHTQIWMLILAIVLSISNIQAMGIWKKEPPSEDQTSDAMKSYDLARSLARQGRETEALDWLETAIHSGLRDGHILDTDPVWSALRNQPRFVLLRRLTAAIPPDRK